MIDLILLLPIAFLFCVAVKLLLFWEDDHPKWIYDSIILFVENFFKKISLDRLVFDLPINRFMDGVSSITKMERSVSWLLLRPFKCSDCFGAWATFFCIFIPYLYTKNQLDLRIVIFLLISYSISIIINSIKSKI